MIAQTWVQTFNKNKNTNSEGTELVLQLLCVTVVNRFPYAEKWGCGSMLIANTLLAYQFKMFLIDLYMHSTEKKTVSANVSLIQLWFCIRPHSISKVSTFSDTH